MNDFSFSFLPLVFFCLRWSCRSIGKSHGNACTGGDEDGTVETVETVGASSQKWSPSPTYCAEKSVLMKNCPWHLYHLAPYSGQASSAFSRQGQPGQPGQPDGRVYYRTCIVS